MNKRTKKQLKRAIGIVALDFLDNVRKATHQWAHGEPTWVSSDGKLYLYSELRDRHLRNIINMLHREREPVPHALHNEAKKRGMVR